MAVRRTTVSVSLRLLLFAYLTSGLLLGVVVGGSSLLFLFNFDPLAATVIAAPLTIPAGMLVAFSFFLYRHGSSTPADSFYLAGGFTVGGIAWVSLLSTMPYTPIDILTMITSLNGGSLGMLIALSFLLYRRDESNAFAPFVAVIVFLGGGVLLTGALLRAGYALDTEIVFIVVGSLTPLGVLLFGSVCYVAYLQKQPNPPLPTFIAIGYLLGSIGGTYIVTAVTNDMGFSMIPGTLLVSPAGMLLTLGFGFWGQRRSEGLTPFAAAFGYSLGVVLGAYTFVQVLPESQALGIVLGSFVGGITGLFLGLTVAFYSRHVPKAYYPLLSACGFLAAIVSFQLFVFDGRPPSRAFTMTTLFSSPVGISLLVGIFYIFYIPDRVEQFSVAAATPTESDEVDKEKPRASGASNGQSESSGDTAEQITTVPTPSKMSLSYDDIEKREPLGTGGNADVYRATVTDSGETAELAIKEPRMSGTLHTETVERLIREAETWQELANHDHIVSVIDYGSEPLPWIGMEYMDASHLGERVGSLQLDQALWTAVATTKGVWHAHRRGVAHLDLKPENILFRSVDNGWDVPKVADWGLAKRLLEHSKSVEGLSVQYAAPEQFDETFGSIDERTDIYQLGAVFYELFTGRPPFEGQATAVMHKTLSERPVPPSEVNSRLPEELDDILLTALAKEKSERHESVVYLRDDLSQLLTQDENQLRFRSTSTLTEESTDSSVDHQSSPPTDSLSGKKNETGQESTEATTADLTYEEIQIGKPINSGSNSTVYRAQIESNTGNVPVALKQLHTDKTLHADIVEQFATEANRWEKLSEHDRIVDVRGLGVEPLPWIALEYMNRGSLHSVIEPLSQQQAVIVGSQIADVVHFAHTRGIAHLSLTPSNVLLHAEDDELVLKVSDWGVGKLTLSHSTEVQALNVVYAAPEQFDDNYGNPGQASDVYALGVLCYELFTGTSPFTGSPTEILTAKKSLDITPPTEMNTMLPREVDTLVETALAPEPSERYESILYLRDALQDLS